MKQKAKIPYKSTEQEEPKNPNYGKPLKQRRMHIKQI